MSRNSQFDSLLLTATVWYRITVRCFRAMLRPALYHGWKIRYLPFALRPAVRSPPVIGRTWRGTPRRGVITALCHARRVSPAPMTPGRNLSQCKKTMTPQVGRQKHSSLPGAWSLHARPNSPRSYSSRRSFLKKALCAPCPHPRARRVRSSDTRLGKSRSRHSPANVNNFSKRKVPVLVALSTVVGTELRSV